MKKLALKTAIVAILALTSISALAKDGGDSSGGGATVCVNGKQEADHCSMLLDFHMRKSRVEINSHPAYQKHVLPVVERLLRDAPEFALELLEAIDNKRWYISDAKIRDLGEKNQTDFSHRQIAIQNHKTGEIWINKQWAENASEEELAHLFLHEMVMHIYLKSNDTKRLISKIVAETPIKRTVSGVLMMDNFGLDYNAAIAEYRHRSTTGPIEVFRIRQLTEDLLSNRLEKENLLYELSKNGFGDYFSTEEFAKAQKNAMKTLHKTVHACELPTTPFSTGNLGFNPRSKELYRILIQDDPFQIDKGATPQTHSFVRWFENRLTFGFDFVNTWRISQAYGFPRATGEIGGKQFGYIPGRMTIRAKRKNGEEISNEVLPVENICKNAKEELESMRNGSFLEEQKSDPNVSNIK